MTNRGRGPARAQVVATPPAGWPRLAAESLSFQREDETRSLAVSLTLPRGVPPGAFRLGAAVRGSDGRLSDGALVVIDYPHIRPRPVERASVAELCLVTERDCYLVGEDGIVFREGVSNDQPVKHSQSAGEQKRRSQGENSRHNVI